MPAASGVVTTDRQRGRGRIAATNVDTKASAMRSTLVKVAALIGVGLLVLSGCASGSPSVAATVNGQVLTESQVTELSQAISDTYLGVWKAQQEASQPAASRTPEQQEAYQTALANAQVAAAPGKYRLVVVGVTIQGRLAGDVLKETGTTITDAQRAQVLSTDPGLTALTANPTTKDLMAGLADAQILFNTSAGLTAGQELAAKATVELNPRYGTWTPSQLAPTGNGSLSMPMTTQQ